MAIITKIEVQAKNKNRVNIFLDGEFGLGCSLEVMIKFGLKENLDCSQEWLNQIVFENEKSAALTKTLNLLSKMLKTEKQIKDYLKQKGYSPQIIEYVVLKLTEHNYINDLNYCNLYVKSNLNKSGKLKIKNDLMQKGVKKDIIDSVLVDVEEDVDTVIRLAKKHLKGKELTFENTQKTYRYLLSKGFGYDVAKVAIDNLKLGDQDGSWD